MKERFNLNAVLQGALNGKSSDQKLLFMEYYGYVRSICNRYLPTSGLVEEAANETFLKVFRKLELFDSARSFKAWLAKVCVNTCIDFIRKEKNSLVFEELTDAQDQAEENEEEIIISGFEEVPILPILLELPPQYRTVFNLFVFEEYKHHEIAEILKISIGTSKSNLSRAKKMIYNQIENNPAHHILKSLRS